jgi:hypothetical protein
MNTRRRRLAKHRRYRARLRALFHHNPALRNALWPRMVAAGFSAHPTFREEIA